MIAVRKLGVVFALVGILISQAVFASGSGEKLFINLTSDEINRAAMAIGFGTMVLKKKEIPVTIFLNVDAVRIADKDIPEHKHANGKSLKEMLTGFLQAGGQVIICPMCMEHVGGLKGDELLDGVQVGGPDVTWPALFAPGTTVLSY